MFWPLFCFSRQASAQYYVLNFQSWSIFVLSIGIDHVKQKWHVTTRIEQS